MTELICVIINSNDILKFCHFMATTDNFFYTKTYSSKGNLLFVFNYISFEKLGLKKKEFSFYEKKIPRTDLKYTLFDTTNLDDFIKINKYRYLKGCNEINDFPKFFYKKPIHEKIIDDIIDGKKLINEDIVSKITISKISVKFIYDSKICEWYYIDENNRYVLDSMENLNLIKIISTEMPKYFKTYIGPKIKDHEQKLKDYSDCLKDADNVIAVNYYKGLINGEKKIIKNLIQVKNDLTTFCQKITNIKKIIEMMKVALIDHTLSDKIDNVNDKLLGFNNGVYDFENDVFRKPLISEYISKTTKYDYEKADKNDKKYLLKLLGETLKDENELKYVLRTIALCLVAHVLDECFYIWIGSGRNGKGFWRDLIALTFGEYYDFMKPNYLTGKILSNHDEEAYDKKGIRICILSEPIVNTKTGQVDADISFLKQIAGLDEQRARAPYGKKCIKYKPKYKLIIQTNNYINFPGNDDGITKKIRNVVFPYSFKKVDEIDKSDTMQKECNESIKDLIKQNKYILAFLSILIDEYNELRKKDFKLDTPSEFIEIQKDYVAENDPVQDFIDNHLIRTEEDTDFVQSSEMYNHFKWCMHEKANGISSVMFKEIMTRKKILWKRTSTMRVYYNIKLKDTDNKKDGDENL